MRGRRGSICFRISTRPIARFPSSRRVPTTTPSQALALMNHSFTMAMAEALAKRLSTATTLAEIRRRKSSWAFQLAFGRKPTTERAGGRDRLGEEHGLRAFCRALLNSSELIYVN